MAETINLELVPYSSRFPEGELTWDLQNNQVRGQEPLASDVVRQIEKAREEGEVIVQPYGPIAISDPIEPRDLALIILQYWRVPKALQSDLPAPPDPPDNPDNLPILY